MGQSARDKFYQRNQAARGFLESVGNPKEASEPQNSELRLFEEDWRFSALPFIRALEAAQMKIFRKFRHLLKGNVYNLTIKIIKPFSK